MERRDKREERRGETEGGGNRREGNRGSKRVREGGGGPYIHSNERGKRKEGRESVNFKAHMMILLVFSMA